MIATVLCDNTPFGTLFGEWGLSVCIEYGNRRILLDTGASDLFAVNAEKLGIDLAGVDFGVLSHAHYDHGNGLAAFFEINGKAPFYIASRARENCYGDNAELGYHYIGLPPGTLDRYADRLRKVDGKTCISPGVTLLGHTTRGLERIGLREGLFVERDGVRQPDDFSHEVSLIFETGAGLVVFNSCSHAGAANILKEVGDAFPDQKIAALIGGFHLFRRTADQVTEFAREVRQTGIGYICTGHCTGDAAYEILERELGDAVHRLRCGLRMEWPE